MPSRQEREANTADLKVCPTFKNKRLWSLGLTNFHVEYFVSLLNCIDYILPAHHFPEYSVSAVQVRLRGMGDEELASVRVWPGIRHRDHSCFMLQGILLQLISKLVAGAAASRACRISALYHEIFDHSMKGYIVIEALFRQEDEVVDCLGSMLRIQLQFDQFLCSFQ